MDAQVNAAGAVRPDRELWLQEAIRLYDVSLKTLRNRIRCGQIPGYKTRGPWGPEWRITARTLESVGLRSRRAEPTSEDVDLRVAALQAELASLQRRLDAERDRVEQADRELGYAMLQCGRLRSDLERLGQHVSPSATAGLLAD